MTDSYLKVLEKNRDAILLAELGAYLHLIGRFSIDFIESKLEGNNTSKFKDTILERSFFGNTQLYDILWRNWEPRFNDFKMKKIPDELMNKKVKNFFDYIKSHTWNSRPKPEGLCSILADAHGIVSAIDKALAGIYESGKQRNDYCFQASVFGYETDIPLIKNPKLKYEFFTQLQESLEKIWNKKFNDDKESFNNYRNFVKLIQEYYCQTIGETRRPNNEISLLNYTHSISSLVKSYIAKILLEEKWSQPKGKAKWQILKIGLDIISLQSRGLKISEILGFESKIEALFDEIKNLIEYYYPLGNEIYRDGSGIYFSMPEVEQTIATRIEEELGKKIIELNTLDYDLHIEITEKSSRSMTNLGKERKETEEKNIFHIISDGIKLNRNNDKNNTTNEICPICKIRTVKEGKERCTSCFEIFNRRSEKWLEEPRETIWIDEIADHNNRVALIVGLFDIKDWLNGELFDTFVSIPFTNWINDNKNDIKNLKIETITDLEKFFEEKLRNPDLNSYEQKLLKSFINTNFNNFNDFFKAIAERDASGKISDNQITRSESTQLLVKLLFRKHPSFPRVNRTWQTTQSFIKETIFEDILKNNDYAKKTERKKLRRERINFCITFTNPSQQDYLKRGVAYKLYIDQILFNIVCIDKENSRFSSVDNLQIFPHIGQNEDFSKFLENKGGFIEGDNIKKEGVRISDCQQYHNFQDYLPFTTIYKSPEQFMTLVPAWDATSILNKIIEKYNHHFSKVKDKLPLHLGLVFFHKKMPLLSVMESGKKILQRFNENSVTGKYLIEKHEDDSNTKEVKITLRDAVRNRSAFDWQISYSTNDPQIEDVWYTYYKVKNQIEKKRTYSIKNPECIHIKELEKGDEVLIKRSLFSYIFLESNCTRLEAGDKLLTVEDYKIIEKIWHFLEKEVCEKKLTLTKIKNLETLLLSKKALWEKGNENYKNLIDTVIKKDLMMKNQKEREFLQEAFLSDLFFESLELNQKILKKKLGD